MDFQITEIHMASNTLMIWEEYTAFGAGSSKWIRLYTLKFPFVADCKSICIIILIVTQYNGIILDFCNRTMCMLLNCGAEENSWESLGLQGDQISQSKMKSTLNIHWKSWCWSWSSNILYIWCKEPTHQKRLWCWGCPDSSVGKESTSNAGDSGSIPGTRRSAGEWIGYPLQYSWVSLVAQLVKNPPAMQETWVWPLGLEDPLEKRMATHSTDCIWTV